MSVTGGNLPSVAKLEEIIMAANKAIKGKLWKEAIILFEHATQLKPQYVDGWLGKAAAQLGAGDGRGAMESYRRALGIDAGSKGAWVGLIDTLHELELYDEEVEACDCLLRLSPRSDEVLLNKGVALHALGKLEEALECFEQVVERRPENVMALNNKGAVLLRLGRLQEALDAFETALALMPENEDVQRNRCLLLVRLGRYGAAVMAAAEMLKAKEEGWLLMLKGLAHAELREMPLALQCLERAKELKPDLEGLDEALGRARSLQKAMKSETETPERETATEPETGQTIVSPQALAAVLYNIGYPTESLRIWKSSMNEENPYDWLGVGKSMLASGERTTGEKCLTEARRRGVNTSTEGLAINELPSVWREISRKSFEGRNDDAAGMLDSLLKEKPDLEKAWRWLGVLRAMDARYAEAETAFRQTVEQEPNSPTALSNLGAVLICSNKTQEASEILRRALKIDSSHPEVLHNLAVVEAQLGRNEEAMELLRMTLRVEERPVSLVVLGSILERMNKLREAAECYEKCLVLQSKNRLAMKGLSMVKAKLRTRGRGTKPQGIGHEAKGDRLKPRGIKPSRPPSTAAKQSSIEGVAVCGGKTARAQPKKKGRPLKSVGR